MKRRSTLLLAPIAILACSWLSVAKPTPQLPKAGVIPDQATAIAVAQVLFRPVFGEEEVNKFLPYRAILEGEVWEVYGTLKPNARGGTPQLRMNKRDGKVLEIWHSQ